MTSQYLLGGIAALQLGAFLWANRSRKQLTTASPSSPTLLSSFADTSSETKSHEEMFDIVDVETGVPTGVTKARSKVHRDGDWHSSVHIWIINKTTGDVLVQKRAACKDSWPNVWDIGCAGHISAGSTPVDTAITEVHEELGLVVKKEELQYMGKIKQQQVINNGTFIDNEWVHIFVLAHSENIPTSSFKLQESEVDEVAYIPLQDFINIQRTDPSSYPFVPLSENTIEEYIGRFLLPLLPSSSSSSSSFSSSSSSPTSSSSSSVSTSTPL